MKSGRVRVLKFGGSSLHTPSLRRHALGHIQDAQTEGVCPIVVVSALGRRGDPYATDTLLRLPLREGAALALREQDLLMACGETIAATVFSGLLNSHGIVNVVLTGGQAGIVTEPCHTLAHIVAITPTRIEQELDRDKVVIVTGFQGVSVTGETTTLGRGGSDITACALGAALQAECVDIFTDVEGVKTADPGLVSDSQLLPTITYLELCHLTQQGAKIMNPRAVALAMEAKLPLRIRATGNKDVGTRVVEHRKTDPRIVSLPFPDGAVTGIAHRENRTKISASLQDGAEGAEEIFSLMARRGVSVDFIQVHTKGISYTVAEEEADTVVRWLEEEGWEVTTRSHCAKISVVGAGMAGVPGVMARIVLTLAQLHVPILQSADSHTTIWVLVPQEFLQKAVKALHRCFGLDREACE
ncbi:aspartate kinase [Pasteuria penetrans]|uniref:aspartate kinase n=1 Tax=Pasteuria penetrans TaxID=86005 RepID=UPI0011ED255C|nr:aspartate kinase [Pasteuria penetrans]